MASRQVLTLEFALEGSEHASTALQQQLATVVSERDKARFEALHARNMSGAAAAAAAAASADAAERRNNSPAAQGVGRNQMSMYDAEDDSWADEATPEVGLVGTAGWVLENGFGLWVQDYTATARVVGLHPCTLGLIPIAVFVTPLCPLPGQGAGRTILPSFG